MRLLYDLLFALFALFYLPLFFIKGKHRGGAGERFGRISPDISKVFAGRRVVWVHAVSVGEIVQAVRLVDTMRDRFPASAFLLTCTTATGRQVAEKLKHPDDTVMYFPVDLRFAVRRFVESVKPSLLIVLETEIWPNLVHELSRRRVPVFIVNGRISDRAIGKYRLGRFFLASVLRKFRRIFVQDERMRKRYIEIGADPEQVEVTGNMKFDWTPKQSEDAVLQRIARGWGSGPSFVCIGGSTHEGEEAALLEAYTSLKSYLKPFRLIIAPRHVERVSAVVSEAERRGIAAVRVSSLGGIPAAQVQESVLVLDQMGVLSGLYRIADAVFVGGSLVPVGGHNPVEPAFFEKPILFGPYMQNFKEMADEFKKAEAVIQVQDAHGLEQALRRLIDDDGLRRRLGHSARMLVFKHQGATQRNVSRILSILSA